MIISRDKTLNLVSRYSVQPGLVFSNIKDGKLGKNKFASLGSINTAENKKMFSLDMLNGSIKSTLNNREVAISGKWDLEIFKLKDPVTKTEFKSGDIIVNKDIDVNLYAILGVVDDVSSSDVQRMYLAFNITNKDKVLTRINVNSIFNAPVVGGFVIKSEVI